ncbi:hypothetical protein ACH4KN_06625 [Streptomyces sp. NPDC017546]|uniref:hypothetical protein n=1 Tax=unclassified Streptomyces TaxID=2593676 RepID=UPI00235E5CFB|nr:hypothetical protein [Streptomyces sp. MMBL 11-1]
MTWSNKSDFADAAAAARHLYEAAGTDQINGRSAFDRTRVNVAWLVYDNTRRACQTNAIDGLIAGGLRPAEGNAPRGAGIDDILRENLQTISQNAGTDSGTILNTDRWSILVNDAWLLGGVHAGVNFYLASQRRQGNIHDGQRLKVYGRELGNLKSFGYAIKAGPHVATGEVAVPSHAGSQQADFAACQTNADFYQSNDKWRILQGNIGQSWN